MIGKGPARNGSTVMVSPSLKLRMRTSQVVVAGVRAVGHAR